MNGHDLLSELYSLLGRTDEDAIAQARAAAESAKLRALLDALRAVWLVGRDDSAKALPTPPKDAQPASRRTRSAKAKPSQVPALEEPVDVGRLVRSLPIRHLTIVGALRSAGMRIAFKPRETRERFLTRIEEALQALPAAARQTAVRELRIRCLEMAARTARKDPV